MDSERIALLIATAVSGQGFATAQKAAKRSLPGYPTNGCAATVSALLSLAGIDVPMTLGAGRLAERLISRGWIRVAVGEQAAGDVGVCFDNGGVPGADHVYLVVEASGTDRMTIADNQATRPHERFASGRGKTPTEYFLRAPGLGRMAPVPSGMVPERPIPVLQTGLDADKLALVKLIDQVNLEHFSEWFYRSSVMAFVEVESAFDPQALRHEPSGVSSYGLMQVLDTTAAWLGLSGSGEQMYEPETSLFYGMKYAAWGWNYLAAHLGRAPSLSQWCEGYNEGYGAAAQGKRQPGYSAKWLRARHRWLFLDVPAATELI